MGRRASSDAAGCHATSKTRPASACPDKLSGYLTGLLTYR